MGETNKNNMETGQINVQTENIFPIIKKFLYSDHEIFLRELVSNAVDATQKLKKLSSMGEVKGELGDTHIEVIIDEAAKTLTIRDRGIGMTSDEVKKYINQIAFSSAEEFLEKFKGTEGANIIGHFGLGFYSAFMVADKVEIFTKSYKEDTEGAHWTCDGSPNFTLTAHEKTTRGSDMVLHINEESKEFLEKHRVEDLLKKYCKFLPVSIRFGTKEDFDDVEKLAKLEPINNPNPAWTRKPADLTNEDYQNFYKELYPFSEPPLFWIHLNVDYPFNLTGILYFPKLHQGFEMQKNKIQLYSNQVFVTDSVENIVPEFLMHLHGIIDSPDIPLNVSRSYLQSDSNVKKINNYITKKVADKLHDLFKDNRQDFEEKWEHIGLFVKFGMISEDKFREKAKSYTLLQNIYNKFFTIEEYREHIKAIQTDKNETLVALYATNTEQQHAYIDAAKTKGYDVLQMDSIIDSHFINHIEGAEEKFTFKRVDADPIDTLIEKDLKLESLLTKDEEKALEELFKAHINNNSVTVQLKPLAADEQPAFITKPEFMRRFSDMQAVSGQKNNMPEFLNLVLNTNHPAINKILKETDADKKNSLVDQVYDLAMLSQGLLKGEKLTKFIKRSVALID
jgi:molecular chaperone HtpG